MTPEQKNAENRDYVSGYASGWKDQRDHTHPPRTLERQPTAYLLGYWHGFNDRARHETESKHES